MELINYVRNVHAANRLTAVEQFSSQRPLIKGDFEGNVTGSWVEIAKNGAGIVSYNNKKYVTKPIGFTSIPPGHAVQLSYAKGIYYSAW